MLCSWGQYNAQHFTVTFIHIFCFEDRGWTGTVYISHVPCLGRVKLPGGKLNQEVQSNYNTGAQCKIPVPSPWQQGCWSPRSRVSGCGVTRRGVGQGPRRTPHKCCQIILYLLCTKKMK